MEKRVGAHFPGRDKRFSKATNSAAPNTAHSTGKGCSPNRIQGKRGRSSCRARKVPIRAPMNPRTIEVKQPMPLRPAIRAPSAPAMEAINSKNRKLKKFMPYLSIHLAVSARFCQSRAADAFPRAGTTIRAFKIIPVGRRRRSITACRSPMPWLRGKETSPRDRIYPAGKSYYNKSYYNTMFVKADPWCRLHGLPFTARGL